MLDLIHGHTRADTQICRLLGSAYWGAGYAREACARILMLLFAVYRVPGVRAEVDTRNQASWMLLEQLGFRRTTLRPAADYFKGSSSDEYTYDLPVDVWQQRTMKSTTL